ncbi:MAG: TIGR03960 family B12-binding radical SAM protein [candidate division Zixibacteria bacterium]|nr:TIGR03960 family B12-binding radical SAM protein [candidate division Zixibacteria bacterium]
MRENLQKRFFPFVMKPGRYAGGEPGQIVKDPAGRVCYLHAFPDKYELGQAYLGLQTLYNVVNQDNRFLCERVFAVDRDAEKIMRRGNIPLFSLETYRPAIEFDAVGFTLTFEMVFTNLLAMLDLAGIPLHSKERGDEHPIVMAGGPAVYNPEPIADFIDCFFIGDAEEGLVEMLGILYEMKGASRNEKLERLCKEVESVYIPRFYDSNRKPVVPFAPERIKARVLSELKPEYYPENPIVPLIDTAQNQLSVEIMRGCPWGCRFCNAGSIYKPVRTRSQNDILHQVETQMQNTGYESVSLLSLSTSDYPGIEELANTLARRLEKARVAVALPSLRPGTITPTLLDAIRRVRKSGLTIAPEAGTERLRIFINKKIPNAAIFDTADMAFRKGWSSIKLYFMVGLPTETEEDLQGIVDIITKVFDIGRAYQGKKTVNVTLSPFMAEPYTPFQWDAIVSPNVMIEKLKYIKRKVHNRNINFKHTSCESVAVQAVLGRGGREFGSVIESVFSAGGRFDSWTEDFNSELWFESFKNHNINLESQLGPRHFSEDLPWSHIVKGFSIEHLQKERHRTLTQLTKYVNYSLTDESESVGESKMEFGRGKKKVSSRNTSAPTKNRVRLRWGRTEPYKYMSHLDNIRMLERAIRRSRIPMAFSQGFHPTMKLSFGPPLPLGITSKAEYVDLTLDTSFMAYMVDNLKETMPEGVNVFDARVVIGKKKSLSALLNRADYILPLDETMNTAILKDKVADIFSVDELIVKRIGKEKTTNIDIRPAIYELSIEDGILRMTLGMGDGGYVRPIEILALLFSGEEVPALAHGIHRAAMCRIDKQGNRLDPMEL